MKRISFKRTISALLSISLVYAPAVKAENEASNKAWAVEDSITAKCQEKTPLECDMLIRQEFKPDEIDAALTVAKNTLRTMRGEEVEKLKKIYKNPLEKMGEMMDDASMVVSTQAVYGGAAGVMAMVGLIALVLATREHASIQIEEMKKGEECRAKYPSNGAVVKNVGKYYSYDPEYICVEDLVK